MQKWIERIAGKEMTARHYIAAFMVLALVLGAGFAGLNYTINDFGLWRHRDEARIWGLEKTSKYLLAHRYVPENFDAVMIGSSVSANFDTRKITALKTYNLSMSGGNITETAAAARAYIDAPIKSRGKTMIVALYPYLTKNSGIKSFQIDPKEYYGSLFSLVPVVIWARKAMAFAGIGGHDYDESVAGWNNFADPAKRGDVASIAREDRRILKALKSGEIKSYPVIETDPQAVRELDALLQEARAKNVRIAAFYYPLYGPAYDIAAAQGEWRAYKAAINPLFRPGEILFDMNTRSYDGIRYDDAAYYDGAHMVTETTYKVLKILDRALKR